MENRRTLLGLGLMIAMISCVDEKAVEAVSNAEIHTPDTSVSESDTEEADTGHTAEVWDAGALIERQTADHEVMKTANDDEGWHTLVIPDLPQRVAGGISYEVSDGAPTEVEIPDMEDPETARYVIGNDDREKVVNTTKWPYSTVVRVFTYWTEDFNEVKLKYACTGTLITEDTVLTAAHCLYDTKKYYGFPYSVAVVPGLYLNATGDAQAPFGIVYCAKVRVPKKFQLKERDELARVSYDYGVLKMKAGVPEAGTRDFGIMLSPIGQKAILLAYHADIEGGGAMTESSDKVRKVFDDNNTFNHYIDCDKKSSGAAITGTSDWENVIYGLNSAQRKTEIGSNTYNVGLLITESVYNDIMSWSEL